MPSPTPDADPQSTASPGKDHAMTLSQTIAAQVPGLPAPAPERIIDPARRSLARATAGLAIAQTALFAIPMIVLGGAIGWPASLRLPAEEALPLIAAQADAVLLGYGAYLVVSLALIPLAFALRAWFRSQGLDGWLLDAVAFTGAAAGLFKTLGIVRWLSVMPMLAAEFERAADPVRREAIALAYRTTNAYAGAVGELLGVQILSGFWLVAVALLLQLTGRRWLGRFGLLCGALFLATALRIIWPMAGMLQSAAVPLALVWFLALAAALWRDSRA
jgi:hypothetical protein